MKNSRKLYEVLRAIFGIFLPIAVAYFSVIPFCLTTDIITQHLSVQFASRFPAIIIVCIHGISATILFRWLFLWILEKRIYKHKKVALWGRVLWYLDKKRCLHQGNFFILFVYFCRIDFFIQIDMIPS